MQRSKFLREFVHSIALSNKEQFQDETDDIRM
jgi:hypothetical protein